MQLTRYTDYAFRMLIYLSLQREGERITITDIAENFDIPRNHLIKVAHRLGQLGYIHTTRGRGGGVILGMATDEIGLGDIVRHMEMQLDVVNCDQPACPIKPQCTLRDVLSQARNAFLETLDQYTLADIKKHSTQLKVLLKV